MKRTRTAVLAAIALVLAILVIARGELSRPEWPAASAGQALAQRIEGLRRYENAADDINARYQELALVYIERAAGIAALKEHPTDDKTLAEDVVRAQLDAIGSLQGVALTVGEPEPMGEIARRVPVGVSYQSGSDRKALFGLLSLGIPSRGTRWESFVLAADPEQRTVRVEGTLSVLIVEPAE